MRGKQGRRARHLLMRRGSLAHHIMVMGNQSACRGCAGCTQTVKLTAKVASTSVRVNIKPDEFTQLLWGVQSWRRPH